VALLFSIVIPIDIFLRWLRSTKHWTRLKENFSNQQGFSKWVYQNTKAFAKNKHNTLSDFESSRRVHHFLKLYHEQIWYNTDFKWWFWKMYTTDVPCRIYMDSRVKTPSWVQQARSAYSYSFHSNKEIQQPKRNFEWRENDEFLKGSQRNFVIPLKKYW